MKRESHLFEILISDENLNLAIDEVNRTHHWHTHHHPNRCTAWVEETKPLRVAELRQIIIDGFVPKPARSARRWDASARKWRTISEPVQWPDQYVHHALIQVLQPKMMRNMDHYCCGSIRGRGPHYARQAIERWMVKDKRGTKYQFCGDIYHFYDSLRPEVVMNRMQQLYKDGRVLDLVERIVKDGILIGLYTSQWFANTTLQPLDRLIRESGLCSHYVRYMDNLTIFGSNKRKLHKLKALISEWLLEHYLQLKDDWQIFRTAGDEQPTLLNPPRNGVTRSQQRLPDAVGYRYGRGYTLLRKHNLLRIKQAINRYRWRLKRGIRILPGFALGLLSRLGQLAHCNNCNIYKRLFKGERIVRCLKIVAYRRSYLSAKH